MFLRKENTMKNITFQNKTNEQIAFFQKKIVVSDQEVFISNIENIFDI